MPLVVLKHGHELMHVVDGITADVITQAGVEVTHHGTTVVVTGTVVVVEVTPTKLLKLKLKSRSVKSAGKISKTRSRHGAISVLTLLL